MTTDQLPVTLFERIRINLPNLSASFRKVADYVVSHYQEVAFLPAAKVAAQCGVSESVVVRFAMALGYDGYPDMVRSIQAQVRQELNPIARLEQRTLTAESAPAQVMQTVLRQDADNMIATAEDAANVNFGQIVQAMVKAKVIYVTGFRGLRNLAGLLTFLLDAAGAETRLVLHGDLTLQEAMRRICKDDMLIAFSFNRYSRRTVDALDFARSKGATTVVVTDSVMAPVARSADLLLRARVEGQSFFNSYSAALSLINALVTAYGLQASDRMVESLKNLEETTLSSQEFFGP